MEKIIKRENSHATLAIVLIVIGGLWMLQKIGMNFNFHFFYPNIIFPIKTVFHSLPGFIFSWPVALIMVGLVLMAGKRSSGLVLIVVGGIFLLPKILFLPNLSSSLILPVVLIGLGVAMVVKRI